MDLQAIKKSLFEWAMGHAGGVAVVVDAEHVGVSPTFPYSLGRIDFLPTSVGLQVTDAGICGRTTTDCPVFLPWDAVLYLKSEYLAVTFVKELPALRPRTENIN